MERVYLDHNATTPLDPRVLAAMLPMLSEDFGNPSSLHWFGQRSRAAVEEARAQAASLIGATPSEVVFAAGGTEADNLALRGVAAGARGPRRKLVVTAIEHHAVLNTARALAEEGFPLETVRVDADGRVDLDDLRAKVDERTALVSIMLANNETGVVQPVAQAAALARERGALVHCDAVQGAGKVEVAVGALQVDLLTLSAHKIYGPKGAGLLYVRRGTPMKALVRGGAQERNRRAGTENVAGIVGLGAAALLARERLGADAARLRALRRGRAARPEYHERLFRGDGGGRPAHGPRPHGSGGLDGRRLCGGRHRALPCPEGDGPAARARPGLAPLLPRPCHDRGPARAGRGGSAHRRRTAARDRPLPPHLGRSSPRP